MRRFRKSLQGIVVVSTLLISTVLLVLVAALLLSLNSEKHLLLRNAHATEALFLGEAGIADATHQLSVNNGWRPVAPNPLVVDFPDVNGRYTIVFDDNDLGVGRDESVNNLGTDDFKDGSHGPDSVPPRTAHVVVKVELKGREFLYEALISRGFTEPVSVPLLTSGEISLRGDVLIYGLESLTNPVRVDAGIHSNQRTFREGVVNWEGDPDEEAYISGKVSTSSRHPQAIKASGNFNAGDVEVGQATQQFPMVDIDAAVHSGRGATVMVPNSGGTTTLSGGDYRYDGGTINGDLVLDGVNLFVDGNLQVNGTIKGSGALYIRGSTSLRGSAELVSDEKSLALFSKGHVTLEGFDGSQYLEERAADDPDFAKLFNDSKWAHEELNRIISVEENYVEAPATSDEWGNSPGGYVDELRAVLGSTTQTTGTLPDPREQDTLGKMATYLETNFGGNESADFLVQRLRDTRTLYQDGGRLDLANDGYDADRALSAARRAANQDFDKLGTSYIQGLIYTNGAVFATNEVQVVGALMAEKNGDSPEGTWSVGGEELRAGDVFLTRRSSLVYNKELVENPFASAPTGPVVVCSWLGR